LQRKPDEFAVQSKYRNNNSMFWFTTVKVI